MIWQHCFDVLLFFPVKNSRFVFGQMDGSWPMLPGDETNSAVDRGPCLSLGFIRCWSWLRARTTCIKNTIFKGVGGRERSGLRRVGGDRKSRFLDFVNCTVHVDKKHTRAQEFNLMFHTWNTCSLHNRRKRRSVCMFAIKGRPYPGSLMKSERLIELVKSGKVSSLRAVLSLEGSASGAAVHHAAGDTL